MSAVFRPLALTFQLPNFNAAIKGFVYRTFSGGATAENDFFIFASLT